MLLEKPSERYSASNLYDRFQHILQGYEGHTGPSSTLLSPISDRINGLKLPDISGKARQAFRTGALTATKLTKLGREFSGNRKGVNCENSTESDEARIQSPLSSTANSSSPILPPRHPGPNPLEVSPEPTEGLLTPTSSDAGELSPSRFSHSAHRSTLSVPGNDELHALAKKSSVTSLIDDIHDLQSTNLSLAEAHEWRDRYGKYDQYDLRVHKVIKSLQVNLKGRDHLFLIDNSRTMGEYRDEVLKAFRTLSYIAKSDSTKIELAFTSSVQKIHTSDQALGETRTTPLVDLLPTCSYDIFGCFMEDNFGQFIDNFVIPRLPDGTRRKNTVSTLFSMRKNPLSLIIFTDGDWGKDEKGLASVQGPIKAIVDEFTSRNLDRKQVMVQFVQFGNDDDEEVSRRLKSLVAFGRDLGV